MIKFRRRAYAKALNAKKKQAEEGDKIVIIKPSYTEEMNGYKIADMFVVECRFSESVRTTCGLHLWDFEYKVIL